MREEYFIDKASLNLSFRFKFGEMVNAKNEYIRIKRAFKVLSRSYDCEEREFFIKSIQALYDASNGILDVKGKDMDKLHKESAEKIRSLDYSDLSDQELFTCYYDLKEFIVQTGILEAKFNSLTGYDKIKERYNV